MICLANIYLVRHGETEWNNKRIMHGQTDIPLNSTGEKQAKLLGVELKNVPIDVCFCSTLQRAVKTAEAILHYHKDCPIIYDERLMEIYKGDLEGTLNSSEAILKTEPLEVLMKHNIESKTHYFLRVKEFYDEILPQYKDKNILVVSHSGTVKMSLFYFNPPEKDIVSEYYNLHVRNCSVKRVDNKMPTRIPLLREYNVDKNRYPLI